MKPTFTDTRTPARTRGAVIYTRVSTGEQATAGTSLESQRDACHAKALTLGLPIVAELEDAGISGAFLLSRPGMQAALASIREGRADTLICANISRYSRDREHQSAIKREVKAAGGRLVFCDMDFDDTPAGDLAFNIMGDFAQYEKAVIRERTMRGRQARAEQGLQPMRSNPPYGYHIVSTPQVLRGEYPADMIGRYVPVEPEASRVRAMFAAYVSGQETLGGMAKRFNQEGVPTARGGAFWHQSTIHNIIKNAVYKGQAVFGKYIHRFEEGRVGQPHPLNGRPLKTPSKTRIAPAEEQITIACTPLISEDLWDQAQARLLQNRYVQGGNPRRMRMLSGLVHCPLCGSAMNYVREKPSGNNRKFLIPANYTCNARAQSVRLHGERFCKAKTYRVADTEQAVILSLLDAITRPEAVEAALAIYTENRDAEANPLTAAQARQERQAIDRALAELKQQEAATVKAQITGIRQGAPPDAYAEVFAALAAQRKDLEDRRGQIAQAARPRSEARVRAKLAPVEVVQSTLRDVHLVLTSPQVTEPEKRAIVAQVVEKVICQKGGADVVFQAGLFGDDETLQTIKTVSIGDLSSSIVHPREVYKDAIIASAASLIIAHNHPSGDPTPSAEDVSVTKRLMQAGELLGIDLLDHVVIGDGVFVSLKERGLV